MKSDQNWLNLSFLEGLFTFVGNGTLWMKSTRDFSGLPGLLLSSLCNHDLFLGHLDHSKIHSLTNSSYFSKANFGDFGRIFSLPPFPRNLFY